MERMIRDNEKSLTRMKEMVSLLKRQITKSKAATPPAKASPPSPKSKR